MLKSLKYLLLGIGIGLITASFFINPPQPVLEKTPGPQFALSARNTGTQDNGEMDEKAPEGRNNEPEEKTDGIEIIISQGMDSFEVANMLYEQAVIESPWEFTRSIIQTGLDRVILPGKYILREDMTAQEIINAITGK